MGCCDWWRLGGCAVYFRVCDMECDSGSNENYETSKRVAITTEMTPSHGIRASCSLDTLPKPEGRFEAARFRLSQDVRVLSVPCLPHLFSSVPNTCGTHASSQFARLVRSTSSLSSKSTRTIVRFHSTCSLLSLDVRPLNVFSHRAHTDPARSPQTMRTSPTLPCLFTPSTSTPTTCLPPSLTLPRILSPVAPRSVLSFVFSHLLTPPP